MSTEPQSIYALLPAFVRNRDALQGGPLEAFYRVLESQHELVRDNLLQLYDDQFIETCAPWVIPYIGALIGYDPIYTVASAGPDIRAEVANTVGYRRRKGTLLAMEQLTHDVSGRTTFVVEEFKRLITTLSLRDVSARRDATADLRRHRGWRDQDGPFTRLNRTIDVRRIAPRFRNAPAPDRAPLDIALHGPGRFNIADVAIWMWRWQARGIVQAPAFPLGDGAWLFSQLAREVPLFQQPAPPPLPFARLMTEADAPQPIDRRDFADDFARFYPASVQLFDGTQPIDPSLIVCANLEHRPGQSPCVVEAGKIAIDPELGRIRFGPSLTPPADLRVTYRYGAPAEMGGGAYDRTANIVVPAGTGPSFSMTVGAGVGAPTLAQAIAAWNQQPAGTAGIIVLPRYESFAIDLTGVNAIQIPAQSQLLIAAAEIPNSGAPQWVNACVTLRGDIQVTGLPSPPLPDGAAAPLGQLQISGIWLAGQISFTGDSACTVLIQDSTLIPGDAPSVTGTAIGATLCLARVISGPLALPASCFVRIGDSIIDAGSPSGIAYAGPDLASPGAGLHVENSTVIGRVWTEVMRLASNTIFHSRPSRHDPWPAPVQARRRQVGCVRFCWLPWNAITPRRYECLPPDAASEAALRPSFVTLRFGQPGYCLLSGDAPLAVWKGADNGSQIGVYQAIQETEAVTNIQIRSAEYLPANLERGVFLIPSRPLRERRAPWAYAGGYGQAMQQPDRDDEEAQDDLRFIGIGASLI